MTLYYLIVAAYAVFFLILAAKRPRVALVFCFSFGPIQRALPGMPFKLTFSDFNVLLAFAVFGFQQISSGARIRWGPLGVPIFIYLAICAFSSVKDWRGDSTLLAFGQMVPYFVFALCLFISYGSSLEDLKPAFLGLLLVGLFFSISVIATFSPFIYGMNKNGLGSSLACVTVVASELWLAATDPKKKRFLLFCLIINAIALMICLSRGAWIGAIAGLAVILTLRREFKTLVRFLIVMGPLILIFWQFLPEENKAFATGFESHRENIRLRLAFIDVSLAKIREAPILGVGVGLRKEMDSTNVILTTMAETGIVGLVAFLFIHFVLIKMVWRAQRSLPRTSWAFSCLAIGAALPIVKLTHGLVDHYWSRGALLLAWAGAGFATRAFFYSQTAWRGPKIQRGRPIGRHRPLQTSAGFPRNSSIQPEAGGL